jgi:hypothetical protein
VKREILMCGNENEKRKTLMCLDENEKRDFNLVKMKRKSLL